MNSQRKKIKKDKEPIVIEDYLELKKCKSSFDSAMKAYSEAWKKLNQKRFVRRDQRKWHSVKQDNLLRIDKQILVNHFDFNGFSKQELEFFNFIIIEKLRGASEEEKNILLNLNKRIVEKINSKPACPHCYSVDVVLNGTRKNKLSYNQKYSCKNCGVKFSFGGENFEWKKMLTIIQLYFEGYSGREIERELIEKHKTYVWWNTILRYLKELKPYLRSRSMTVTQYDKWIKICACGKNHKKVILNFNYCSDCDDDIYSLYIQLKQKIQEANLLAKPYTRNKRNRN